MGALDSQDGVLLGQLYADQLVFGARGRRAVGEKKARSFSAFSLEPSSSYGIPFLGEAHSVSRVCRRIPLLWDPRAPHQPCRADRSFYFERGRFRSTGSPDWTAV